MSANNDNALTNDEQDTKKILPMINSSSLELLILPRDEFSLLLNFLTIEEVIMLSLSCKSINTFLKEHFQKIHPYVVNSYSKGKYPEWSIGRALNTYQKLVVNHYSYNEVNDILDSIIEKSEPFTKLTKFVELTDYDLDLKDFEYLFSKPIRKPIDNVKYVTLSDEEKVCEKKRNLKSIPIGFLVKELSIDDMDLYHIELFRLLTHFRSLEKLTLDSFSELDRYAFDSDSVEVPVFEHLKHIQLKIGCGYEGNEIKLVYDLLKLAPNLEYLEIIFPDPIGDDFVHFFTQKCPKLKDWSVRLFLREVDTEYLYKPPKLVFSK